MNVRFIGLVAGALSVSSLAGCATDETYQRPTTVTPPAWKEPVTVSSPWVSPDGWKLFHSKALDALMEKGQADNFDLAAAAARVREADALAEIAGASLLPRIDAGAGAGRQRSPALPGIQSVKQGTVFSPVLSASYELDFWGKNSAAAAAAQASASASRFDEQTVALTIQSSIAEAYVRLLAVKDRLDVARAHLAEAQQILDALDGRMQIGAATKLDVAQQRAEVEGLKAALPLLERQFGEYENSLAILVGSLPEQLALPAGSLREITLPTVGPGLPSELLMRRPDVQAADAQLRKAQSEIAIAQADRFPQISLTAAGGFASNALTGLFQPESSLFNLAASLVQPVFDGGRIAGDVAAKKAHYDVLAHLYQKAVFSAFADVENALMAVRQTGEQERAQSMAEVAARESFEISQARMEAGATDIITVLNTQRTLFTAQDALTQARLEHAEALISLFKAMGGGWSENT